MKPITLVLLASLIYGCTHPDEAQRQRRGPRAGQALRVKSKAPRQHIKRFLALSDAQVIAIQGIQTRFAPQEKQLRRQFKKILAKRAALRAKKRKAIRAVLTRQQLQKIQLRRKNRRSALVPMREKDTLAQPPHLSPKTR